MGRTAGIEPINSYTGTDQGLAKRRAQTKDLLRS